MKNTSSVMRFVSSLLLAPRICGGLLSPVTAGADAELSAMKVSVRVLQNVPAEGSSAGGLADPDAFLADLEDLNSNFVSTFSKVQQTDFTDWLRQCVHYFKQGGFGQRVLSPKYSTYNLKDAPSGLCNMQLYTSFKGAFWNDTVQDVLYETDLLTAEFDDVADRLPPMGLPAYMSFPQTAKDVAEIVKFANVHGVKVSVKNSGHSYTASSTSEGSININLRKYPKYSFTDVYECDEGQAQAYGPLSGPPCKLALARGKTAVARVGGGQGNDDIYRSVMDFNFKEPRERRYNVLGGAEGMIGGGGGFMMGGGLGRGEERMYGCGADQVLELEMVLPDGKHVKFGPTEWEENDGFIYPQTTKVEGKCNDNVDHDESKWEWADCPEGRPFANVTFEDLWFAVRGGGGGTWGVVLSAFHQLHELTPQLELRTTQDAKDTLYETCAKLESEGVSTCEDMKSMVHRMYLDFLIDLLWNFDNDIGVNEELSLSCGFTGPTFRNPLDADPELKCHGHGVQDKFQEAWKTSVSKTKYLLDGYGEADVCALQSLVYMQGGSYDQWHRNMMLQPLFDPNRFYSPAGLYQDSSGPEGAYYGPSSMVWTGAIFPLSYLKTKSKDVFDLLINLNGIGGHTLPFISRSDGMTPQPHSYRSGGLQTAVLPFATVGQALMSGKDPLHDCDIISDPEFAADVEQEVGGYQATVLSHLNYDPTSGVFPGFTEYNHIHATYGGVLKSDPTKPCPPLSTNEEKKLMCLSPQETVWGTKNFIRLTAIKNGIDPENVFDVHFGIGNNERAGSITDYCAAAVSPSAAPSLPYNQSTPQLPPSLSTLECAAPSVTSRSANSPASADLSSSDGWSLAWNVSAFVLLSLVQFMLL